MKKRRALVSFVISGIIVLLIFSFATAGEYNLLGRPLNLFGYVTVGGSFSEPNNDRYDNQQGLNSALMNIFLEGDYAITRNLKFYGSGMLTVDWIYQLRENDGEWNDKQFSKSKSYLNVDDKYWQLLKEAHFTWSPENFSMRVGKQIVAWGETDGFRLMDQINPQDLRRGFGDVEFETTIIPIWLIKADYSPPNKPTWLQDLNFEFTYNPNADYIPNQPIKTGNDVGGIWAPNVVLPGPPPFYSSHMGSAVANIKTPKQWEDGNEFAFRIRALAYDSVITLNAFYGYDNDYVSRLVPPYLAPIPPHILASDGKTILHPYMEGYYPLFRFLGGTYSRDIPPLKASILGGVAPVVRIEALYAYESTFAFTKTGTPISRFDTSDEVRAAIGVDWKVKIPILNPRAYFSLSGQFYYRRINDYPSDTSIETIQGLEKDNYQTTLGISTSYFHQKLTPSFFWLRDINSQSDFFRYQLVYDYSNNWHFTLGALILGGDKSGQGFQLFDNKDQLYFKISYKWG